MKVIYLSSQDIRSQADVLNKRWEDVQPIPGLQKIHAFKPAGRGSLLIGRFASDLPFQKVYVLKQHREADDTNEPTTSHASQHPLHMKPLVGDWVLVRYDGSFFPGEVKVVGDDEVKVAVMVASGSHFKWPPIEDCIFYPLTDVVMMLSPPIVKSARGTFDFIEKW